MGNSVDIATEWTESILISGLSSAWRKFTSDFNFHAVEEVDKSFDGKELG